MCLKDNITIRQRHPTRTMSICLFRTAKPFLYYLLFGRTPSMLTCRTTDPSHDSRRVASVSLQYPYLPSSISFPWHSREHTLHPRKRRRYLITPAGALSSGRRAGVKRPTLAASMRPAASRCRHSASLTFRMGLAGLDFSGAFRHMDVRACEPPCHR